MKLEIIYGRAGTGKSQTIYNEIKKKVDSKVENKIYIITPEQFSFTAERKLMKLFKATTKVEVLTFERMAYRILNQTSLRTKNGLKSSAKAMLLYDIASKQKENLNFLGKSDENIDLMITQLTEFKKHKVSYSNLENAIKNIEDPYLKAKLKDMEIIYKEFEEKIDKTWVDENDLLNILYENLENSEDFKGSYFYIDEFAGFTKQEYMVIRKLFRIASGVTITVCSDDTKIVNPPEQDVFYANKETIKTLEDIAQEENIQIIQRQCKIAYRFKTPELKHLEENINAIPYKIYEKDVENLSIYLAQNQYEEVENVAKKISSLVKDEGFLYQDISVITKDLETYGGLCRAIFEQYKIPAFIDEKNKINQNNLIKYILGILEIFAQNWSYESVFSYLKSGYVDISEEDLEELEIFCIKWEVKAKKWKEKWNFPEEEQYLEKLNKQREKIVEPLIKLKEKIAKENERKTAQDITRKMYEFLIENQIDKKVEENIQKLEKNGQTHLASQLKDSWNTIINLFDEIVLLFKDQKMGFDTYYHILKAGITNSNLGRIPQTQDQVMVGDVDRSKSHTVRAIFILGLNDGVFPSANKAEGFFADEDRQVLKKQNIELAKGTIEKMYEENFNIYRAFTTAEERLYLSYCSSNSKGEGIRPSTIFIKIKKQFPKLEEKSSLNNKEDQVIKNTALLGLLTNIRNIYENKPISDKWFAVYKYLSEDEDQKNLLYNALKGLFYTNIPEKISSESIEKLYGKSLHTTISRLEKYSSCAFSYYLQYGLKLSDKKTLMVKPIDYGSFMHDVLETFFDKILKKQIQVNDLDEDKQRKVIDQIIEEKLLLNTNYIFTSTAKYRILVKRLKSVIYLSIKYIVENLKNSKFEIIGNEVEFTDNVKDNRKYQYAPIVVELEDGRKVFLTGKIDRIDSTLLENEKYIRIIDYKSSEKDLDINQIAFGLQLQLLTYTFAIINQEKGIKPAGALYFALSEPKISKAYRNMSKEQIEEKIRQSFAMKGIVLSDLKVLKAMDENLDSGKSSYLPITLTKDGDISKKGSNTVTKEQFDVLQKYTIKLIRQISEEILKGNITPKPYYNLKNKQTPCKYCPYKSICQFNPRIKNNKYRYIPQNIDIDELAKKCE